LRLVFGAVSQIKPFEDEDIIKYTRMMKNSLPFGETPYVQEKWQHANKHQVLISWSNDPQDLDGNLFVIDGMDCLLVIGYVRDGVNRTNSEAIKKIWLDYNKDTQKMASKVGGVFVLVHANAEDNSIKAYTSHSGLINLYYAYDNWNHMSYISSRANALANILGKSERHHLSAIATFIPPGYYPNDNTPFNDVYAILGNTKITLSDGIKTKSLFDSSEMDAYDNKESLIADASKALTESVLCLFGKSHSENTIGLTGGKDSRLLLSALLNQQIDFTPTLLLQVALLKSLILNILFEIIKLLLGMEF
jgi:hypothetical protein